MIPSNSADIELQQLIELFYDDPSQLGQFVHTAACDLSEIGRQLLAHDRHMTVTVELFHQGSVDVQVLESRQDTEHYFRKILLTRKSDSRVVMFGIVRLNLAVLSPQVRAEIESHATPLGRILIEHNVLRVVKLGRLFQISPGEDLRQLLQLQPAAVCHGRTAMIFCEGQPAIELLEIVPD